MNLPSALRHRGRIEASALLHGNKRGLRPDMPQRRHLSAGRRVPVLLTSNK
jgi:hypothetical protein